MNGVRGIRRLSWDSTMMESHEGLVAVLPIPITFLTGIDLNIQYQDGVRCSDLVSASSLVVLMLEPTCTLFKKTSIPSLIRFLPPYPPVRPPYPRTISPHPLHPSRPPSHAPFSPDSGSRSVDYLLNPLLFPSNKKDLY